MGYYIETPMNLNKAEYLKKNHGAREVEDITDITRVPEGEVVVCVVDNFMFEAAGIAYDQKELDEFHETRTGRPRRWLLMKKDIVVQLCPRIGKEWRDAK